ncbi:acetate kinase [Saccharospirillum sp. HFRX-1]|uniref:acetate/propionate family kinase n=1 Tax=unclassified Saccharospirillum TaxID=2633430 RepID=UPI0037167512
MTLKTYILVINSGSSSLKFSLFSGASKTTDDTELFSGLAERLGTPEAVLTWQDASGKQRQSLDGKGHKAALEVIVERLEADYGPPQAIGHRIVHGGEFFNQSVVVDESVVKNIDACASLAPLHNPAALLGIRALQSLYPEVPQVVVFDTSFHQTLAPEAFLYAVPKDWYTDLGVRRYGFHGTSHRYVAGQAVEQLQLDPNDHGVISAHLGNGCSATAVRNGRAVDTTMGLTPLEGLVMGTRSGDVDPSLHAYLADRLGLSLDEITEALNRKSGLLGLSGLSNDMRTLIEAADAGNEDARLAIDVFCFRLARKIGGIAMSLSRLDALVFTGGIGENAAVIRSQVLGHLSLLGFSCDEAANLKPSDHARITRPDSTAALVIPTREEWMIAQDTRRLTEVL